MLQNSNKYSCDVYLNVYFTQTWKCCHLLTYMFQIFFFFLSFEHKYILKNVDYQTVAGSHWCP